MAGDAAMKLLQNKWFWIILGGIILFIIIRRKWGKFTEKASSRLGAQYGDWQEGTISEARKSQVEGLAEELYDALASWYEWEAESELMQINALNDNELEYAARHYEEHLTNGKQSMYDDIDEEWLPATDMDEKVMTRLKRLGLM